MLHPILRALCVQSRRPEAAVNFLQRVCANDMNQPVGSVMHTAMLNERGRYENDCSVARTATGQFLVVSSAAQVRPTRTLILCFTSGASTSANTLTAKR